jgi:hypothetical protein
VDVERVFAAYLTTELADRLDERLPLDVSNRAADLDDDDVGVMLPGSKPQALLDLISDVRDDLDRAAEIVTAPFFGDDRGVDLSSRDVRGAGEVLVGEPLVVSKVEIGLRAVVGNEDLTVLVWGHGARIDIEIRVELDGPDTRAPALEQPSDRSGGDAFADR